MQSIVSKSKIPTGSEIEKYIRGAYYFDTYQSSIVTDEHTALDIYLKMVSKTPEWINFLMAIRNKAVSIVGLKNLGHLGEISQLKSGTDYKVGDRVGIFSVLFIGNNEVILGDSDKHLDVKLSVFKSIENKLGTVSISTVVHVHNLFGRLYMFAVIPAHKIIAPSMLKKINKT